jgi:predicted alpha/beta-hydrolase family hydrolase
MRASRWIAVALLAGAAAGTALAPVAAQDTPAKDHVPVATPRGAALVGNLHLPKTPNGVGVVIAPGQGYHRDKPLVRDGAEAFAAAGFTALRFDWAYFTAKGSPSAGLATEADDLDGAIAHVRALPGVERIVLVGKSLGSLVALKRAKAVPGLAGLVLWTFPIVDEPMGALRPGTEAVLDAPCPTLVVVGDRDPICPLVPLYTLLARARDRIPAAIVLPGAHSFDLAKDDEARTLEHQRIAIDATVLWARRL